MGKFDFLENMEIERFLDGAWRSYYNALDLKKSSEQILDSDTKQFGIFLLCSAYEEMAKAVFCILVFYGQIPSIQIQKVFADHKIKIALFDAIYQNDEFYVENGEFVINGKKNRGN
ncbi:MAG TPA: hypothetical protein VJJ25_01260 [Nitrosopumilaceae archaeon]|nr:hypothetical protein [Nitrosopumilaceae archaeon]